MCTWVGYEAHAHHERGGVALSRMIVRDFFRWPASRRSRFFAADRPLPIRRHSKVHSYVWMHRLSFAIIIVLWAAVGAHADAGDTRATHAAAQSVATGATPQSAGAGTPSTTAPSSATRKLLNPRRRPNIVFLICESIAGATWDVGGPVPVKIPQRTFLD